MEIGIDYGSGSVLVIDWEGSGWDGLGGSGCYGLGGIGLGWIGSLNNQLLFFPLIRSCISLKSCFHLIYARAPP